MFRDTVVDESTQKERENRGDNAEIAESNELQNQGGSSREEGSTFDTQFTQRMKKKRGKGAPVTSPKANRKKRSREVGGSEDANLFGRPIATPVNCFKKKAPNTKGGD